MLRGRERDEQRPHQALPFRATSRGGSQLELFAAAKRSVRLGKGMDWVRRWLRFGRRGARWLQDPERAAHRAMFRLARKAMAKPMCDVSGCYAASKGAAFGSDRKAMPWRAGSEPLGHTICVTESQ